MLLVMVLMLLLLMSAPVLPILLLLASSLIMALVLLFWRMLLRHHHLLLRRWTLLEKVIVLWCSRVPLIACLAHMGRHYLLDSIVTAVGWHVITILSLCSATAGDEGTLILHIVAIESAGLQGLWIGLTLPWLANHVHADMLTLSVDIVLVG